MHVCCKLIHCRDLRLLAQFMGSVWRMDYAAFGKYLFECNKQSEMSINWGLRLMDQIVDEMRNFIVHIFLLNIWFLITLNPTVWAHVDQ